MFKRVSAAVLSAAMICSLAACSGQSSTETTTAAAASQTAAGASAETTAGAASAGGEFILGSPQPLTGVNAQAAQATLNGIILAVEELNAEGGLNGQTIKLVTYDDQGSPEEAVKIANKMVEVDKVDAVIGPLLSTCQMAQGALLNDAKIPTIGIGLSPSFMENGWDYIVRSSLNSDYVMKILAQNMVDLDIHSLAIFSGQDDSSKKAAGSMKAEAEAVGITVTTTETYVDGDTDFSGQAAKLINTKPDAIYAATYANVQPIIAKQLRQFGFEGLCFNKELFQADSLRVAGSAANGWIFAYPYISYKTVEECDIPNMKEFIVKYEEKYGALPYHEGAMRGYDAVKVLAEGIKNAGSTDPDAIMAGIKSINGLEGLGGTFDYTSGDGEGLHSCNSYVIADEKYTVLDKWVGDGGFEAFRAGK